MPTSTRPATPPIPPKWLHQVVTILIPTTIVNLFNKIAPKSSEDIQVESQIDITRKEPQHIIL